MWNSTKEIEIWWRHPNPCFFWRFYSTCVRTPSKYNPEQIIKILLQPDESKICHGKPTAVTRSASYVVNVHNLRNPDDIKDELGIWKYSGSHAQAFKVYHKEDSHMTVEKCCEGASGANVVLLRHHCIHQGKSNVCGVCVCVCVIECKVYVSMCVAYMLQTECKLNWFNSGPWVTNWLSK